MGECPDCPDQYPKMISCGDFMALTKGGATPASTPRRPPTVPYWIRAGQALLLLRLHRLRRSQQAKCSPAYCCNMTTCGTWRERAVESAHASLPAGDLSLARRYLSVPGRRGGCAGFRDRVRAHAALRGREALRRRGLGHRHDAGRAIRLAERRWPRPTPSSPGPW